MIHHARQNSEFEFRLITAGRRLHSVGEITRMGLYLALSGVTASGCRELHAGPRSDLIEPNPPVVAVVTTAHQEIRLDRGDSSIVVRHDTLFALVGGRRLPIPFRDIDHVVTKRIDKFETGLLAVAIIGLAFFLVSLLIPAASGGT